MPQIRPITDLRNTTEISNLCHASTEPVFITKNGYGDMVVMSMEAYDELVSSVSIDSSIARAEAEYEKSNVSHNARTELPELRRKCFG